MAIFTGTATDETITPTFVSAGLVGGLAANAFFLGRAAGDADDRIGYDSATGNLLYNAETAHRRPAPSGRLPPDSP